MRKPQEVLSGPKHGTEPPPSAAATPQSHCEREHRVTEEGGVLSNQNLLGADVSRVKLRRRGIKSVNLTVN